MKLLFGIVRTKQSWWIQFSVAVFLVTITWIIFGQTFHHQFINYDDPLYVYDNPRVRAGMSWNGIEWAFTHIHSQNWHPLTTISHMLDCQLFGVNAEPQHLVNVFWHSVATILLFILLARMTGNVWASGFVAAVFAIHPLRVESVAWIAERKDVLSGFFFMATLLAYFHWTQNRTVGRYIAVAILFACGLMSKPMLVTTPIVLLLLDYWPIKRFQDSEGRGQRSVKLIVEKIPLFALSIGSMVATFWAQNFALGSTEFLPLKWRITNALFSYFEYVRQMFWPIDLIPFYVHPENRLATWRLAIAILFLIGVTAIALLRRRENPYLIVGWLWYLVMLIPVIGIVQVGLQGHADRYTYLPQIGLYVACVWLTCELTRFWRARKFILVGGTVIIVGTLSMLSAKQTTYWRDTETLWRRTLIVTPQNDVAQTGLAGILFVRGRIDEAIAHYEQALQLRDGNVAAHFGLARALAARQKIDPAIFHLQKALEIQPDYIGASNDLGILFARKGEIRKAIAAWQQTLSFDADNADAANNIAWVRSAAVDANLRDGPEAIELAQRAIRSGGENPVVLRTLAAAQAETGQFAQAVASAERGERLAAERGDRAMADNLRSCAEAFRRGEPLHVIQGSD